MDAEKIERLILLVNDYPELYDMADKNYSNQIRRENIWSDIGKKLKENGDICKKKWKVLRDAFQKAARSKQTKSGQAATSTRKWKYWDAMSFLLPHIKGRETHTNVRSEETDANFEDGDEINTESHFEHTEEETFEDSYHENPTSPSLSLPNTPQTCSSSEGNVSRPVPHASARSDALPNKKTKTTSRKADSMPEILQEYIQEKKRSRLEKQSLATATQSTDSKALLEFFTSMARTTSTFPPLWQAKVKNKMFEIVNLYELALLEASSATPAPPLLTESLTQTQTQSTVHTQQMHILPMQSRSPVQNQSTTNSLLCYNNEPVLITGSSS